MKREGEDKRRGEVVLGASYDGKDYLGIDKRRDLSEVRSIGETSICAASPQGISPDWLFEGARPRTSGACDFVSPSVHPHSQALLLSPPAPTSKPALTESLSYVIIRENSIKSYKVFKDLIGKAKSCSPRYCR
jgi:hypothetical protein